ncbi:MAG TPA: hypothetical protein VFX96_06855 [Pyrinomonadaceae bacterium]|nr:hypothetical protein [Pyrinomonadaceae bacterium]
MPKCMEWAEQRVDECNEWEDEGYDRCDEWDDRCCDWWPCSWGCKLITWVCVGFVWVSKWVCVGWTVLTTVVCVAWDIVTAIVNAIVVSLESIFGWLLSALAYLLELVLRIPLLGALIRWVLNIVTTVFWTAESLGDALLGFLGIRPEKRLRVCTVILNDETGAALCDPSYAVDLLQVAADVLKREANVRLLPLAPWKYASGFGDAETVTDDWVTTEVSPSDADTLDAPCGAAGLGSEWGMTGSKFQAKVSNNCFFGAWRRLVGYGAPVTCFIVRSIGGDPNTHGCSLLWLVDYVTVIFQPRPVAPAIINRRVLAHEYGHACNLLGHLDANGHPKNLMGSPWDGTAADLTQTHLYDWQVVLLRASRHVTYF